MVLKLTTDIGKLFINGYKITLLCFPINIPFTFVDLVFGNNLKNKLINLANMKKTLLNPYPILL